MYFEKALNVSDLLHNLNFGRSSLERKSLGKRNWNQRKCEKNLLLGFEIFLRVSVEIFLYKNYKTDFEKRNLKNSQRGAQGTKFVRQR